MRTRWRRRSGASKDGAGSQGSPRDAAQFGVVGTLAIEDLNQFAPNIREQREKVVEDRARALGV
jgi:hypothetical protein